jgi:restriction system protein
MSRSSYSHHSSSNDDIGFVVTIIIAVIAYRYLQDLIRLEHTVVKELPAIGVIVFAIILLLLCVKLKYHRRLSKRNFSEAEIDSMDGLEFEEYVASLLKQQGYSKVKLTEKYDYGVDIVAHKGGIRWGIQVKRYSGLVKMAAVQQVVAGLRKYRCDNAMVITNSNFSEQAQELAKSNDCILIDRQNLLKKWL